MYLISLLLWTMSQDLLINLTTLLTFWLFHENLTLLVPMFFIQCTLPDLIGKWFFHKQKYLIFFQGLCKFLLLLKFHPHTVTGTPTSTFRTETFGGTDYTLKYQILLTIDMRHVSNLGSSKFITGAKNDKEQICYSNYNKKIELLLLEIRRRIKKFDNDRVHFKHRIREFD